MRIANLDPALLLILVLLVGFPILAAVVKLIASFAPGGRATDDAESDG